MTRVLIVDDKSENLYLLQTLLRAKGYTVESAANGAEALEAARRSPPDVIVSDILMPVMDGFSLCRAWRADECLRHIPFIFYTATYTDPKDEAFALSLGADRFITKPIDPQRFLELLVEVLETHTAGEYTVSQETQENDMTYYREYSQALVRKLEDKMEQLRRTNQRLEMLYQAGVDLAVFAPPQTLIKTALQAAIRAFAAEVGVYFVYEEPHARLAFAQLAGASPALQDALQQLPPLEVRLDGSALERCARLQSALVLGEDAAHACHLPADTAADLRAALIVPVLCGQRLLGVLALFSRTANAWEEEDERPACLLAGSLAAALENARLMDQVQTSEALYRTVLETSGEAIISFNTALEILLWNRGAEQVFGYTRQEILGKPCDMICPPHSKGKIAEALGEVRQRGTLFGLSVELQAKDGRMLPVEMSLTYLERQQGYTAILRDMTRQHQADEEREKLRDQLQQAQKLDSIGRLAGGVAHDFNNLLGVIIGHTETALNRFAPDEACYPIFEEIHTTARRSAELTRQLLTFARRQTVNPRVLDLNHTIENMLRMLKRLIGEDIELEWVPAPGVLKVKIDPVQVDQLLVNLLVNAREAIDGVGRVSVETHDLTLETSYCDTHIEALPGRYVMLAVSDSGRGMTRETLLHLFEPFYTTKEEEQHKGTGLGLATVYGIVKQQGGFINVYSEVGGGTTFKIYLPWADEEVEMPAALPQEGQAFAGGSETILLVEDEEGLLELCRENLEELGYTVLAATSPVQALELARQHGGQIHLLMTDMVMPGMNGRQLAEALTQTYPHLKTLYTSGYTANVIVHHGVLEAGVHFIQKPYLFRELSAKIRQMLDA
ncbi:MAG: response regulator [Anaerolineae bacterium]|nr:response regulator [Anaerolineae bacterium]